MTPLRETIKILEEHGWVFDKHGKKHDRYKNSQTRQIISVKRHDFDENDQRYILKEAGIK